MFERRLAGSVERAPLDSPVSTGRARPGSTLRAAVVGSLGAKAVEVATLVLLATVVPKALGPSDFGRFSVRLTVVTLGSLALTLGGPTLMARFVPTAAGHERVALARAMGARLARGRAAQLAAIGAVLAIAAVVDPRHFPLLDSALVLVALALNVATSLALQVALGLGVTAPWTMRYPLQNGVLIGAVLALYPPFGVRGTTVAILVSAAVGAAFAAMVVVPLVRGRHARVAIPPGALRFGALQAGGAAFVQLSQRGGVLAVALLAGSTVQTGYAGLAIGIALGATYAVLQTFTVSLPHLAHRAGDSSGLGVAEVTLRRLAGAALWVLVPPTLLAAAFLDELVPAIFGGDYRGAVAAFGPALALLVLAPLGALMTQASALRLRPDVACAAGVAAATTFMVVAIACVPPWGAAGGTGAGLAGAIAGSLVSLHSLRGAAGLVVPAVSLGGSAMVLLIALVA